MPDFLTNAIATVSATAAGAAAAAIGSLSLPASFARGRSASAPAASAAPPAAPPGPAADAGRLPRDEGPLAGLGTRLQDLPTELWLDIGAYLDDAGRESLFAGHPDLRREHLAAAAAASLGGPTSPQALGEAVALAGSLPAPLAAGLLSAVVRRVGECLGDCQRVGLEVALYGVLAEALETVHDLPASLRGPLFCQAVEALPPRCSLRCRPLPQIHGHFATLLLDGLVQALAGGLRQAEETWLHHPAKLLTLGRIFEGELASARQRQQVRAAAVCAWFVQDGMAEVASGDDRARNRADRRLCVLAEAVNCVATGLPARLPFPVAQLLRMSPGELVEAVAWIAEGISDRSPQGPRHVLLDATAAFAVRSGLNLAAVAQALAPAVAGLETAAQGSVRGRLRTRR